jgi:SAM-dependent methyltransferase
MPDDRVRLRTTFDGAALLYDEVRPGYPEKLFNEVVSLPGIPAGGRVLEVGCGTGQATLPFARRGYEVLCVELGENLAAVARRNLSGYPRVEILTGNFEEIRIPEEAFDLLISATAFHWLDPVVAYPKAAHSLKPGGAIALFWNEHVHTDADPGFFAAAQDVYAREAPEIWDENHDGPPPPEGVPDRTGEIEDSGLFGPVVRRSYPWDQPYDAAGYLRVLDTYSGHMSLKDETRTRLYAGISRLIGEEYGGRIVKGYQTSLYVARRS